MMVRIRATHPLKPSLGVQSREDYELCLNCFDVSHTLTVLLYFIVLLTIQLLSSNFTFTFMYLAGAFIQRDSQKSVNNY